MQPKLRGSDFYPPHLIDIAYIAADVLGSITCFHFCHRTAQ